MTGSCLSLQECPFRHQHLKNHEKLNFGTEGGVKEGSVAKNIDSVCGCIWLMTYLIRTTGHLGRQGEDQGAEDKL